MRAGSLAVVIAVLALLPAAASARHRRAASPKTNEEAEARRPDVSEIDARTREAMAASLGEGDPDGGVSTVISMDKGRYLPDDEPYLTVVWTNNTNGQVRVCRRLILDANFRPLVFLDDKARLLPSASPKPPSAPFREADFVTLPPYGEHSETFSLENLPRFGLEAGKNVKWGFNLDRPGKYKLRVGIRSVPVSLVPEGMVGDPTTKLWLGSTLSNVVEFQVRRR